MAGAGCGGNARGERACERRSGGRRGGGGGRSGRGLYRSLHRPAIQLVLCWSGFPLPRRVRGLCFSTESKPDRRCTKQSCTGSKLVSRQCVSTALVQRWAEMACTGWASCRRSREQRGGGVESKTNDARRQEAEPHKQHTTHDTGNGEERRKQCNNYRRNRFHSLYWSGRLTGSLERNAACDSAVSMLAVGVPWYSSCRRRRAGWVDYCTLTACIVEARRGRGRSLRAEEVESRGGAEARGSPVQLGFWDDRSRTRR